MTTPVFGRKKTLRPDYLLAFRADPDQVLAPPDAPWGARKGGSGRGQRAQAAPAKSRKPSMSWCRLGGSKVRFRLREEHHDIENDRNHLKSIAHNNLIYIYK